MTADTWLIWCMWPGPDGYCEYLRDLDDELVTFEAQAEAERAACELQESDSYDGKFIARPNMLDCPA